ncbi:MAG: DUF2339 domain-containing protein [Saezia sp.]
MEGLIALMVIILVVMLIVVPIMTFTNSSNVSNLREKIKKLEERVQQQGVTLKELYAKMEQAEHLVLPQRNSFAREEMPAETQFSAADENDQEDGVLPVAQTAAIDIPIVAVTTSDFNEAELPDGQQIAVEQPVQLQEVIAEPLYREEDKAFSEAVEEKKSFVTQERVKQTQPPQKEPRFKLPEVPNLFDQAITYIKQWFKTGNMPVKVGVLVLFAGVASLLNYAATQGWINPSIQAKFAVVTALSMGAFVFAWRKREKHRMFSLSLQGGSIGILLLTIFAAYKLYDILPASIAFGITIVLVAFAGFLAVMQNAMVMAIFAVLAGFLAPIWLSTGGGNHVALFSYYAILNAGILGMSWYRPWRFLNLLGFAFTFGIGALWGYDSYIPEKFATTEPFLLLFFAFYLFIPILYARKYKGDIRNKIDASLVFGAPLIAFALQAKLLEDSRYALAGCAFGLGLIYFALKHFFSTRENLKDFTPAYLALGMGFTTLAVPLAFSAQQTSCIYALQGAALVWWGGRQNRLLSRLSGVGLQILASFAFMFTLGSFSSSSMDVPIANASFINMLILSGAALFSAWCYRYQSTPWLDKLIKAQDSQVFSMPNLFYIWGLFWWCIAGTREIHEFVAAINRADFAIIFVALTAWLAAEANKKWSSRLLGLTTMMSLCLLLILVFWQNQLHETPLMGLGWLAWAGYIVLGARSIMLWRRPQENAVLPEATVAQFLWWPTLTLVATLSLNWLTQQYDWNHDLSLAITALPMLVVVAMSLWFWRIVRLPLGEVFNKTRDHLQGVYFGAGLVIWSVAMFLPANNVLLPWVPFLNPVEFLQVGFAYMLWVWLKRQNTQPWFSDAMQGMAFAVMGLLMLSVTTLRAVHHWGDVPWDGYLLTSDLALRYLSIVWSMVTIMVSRHAIRKNLVGLQECCLVLQAAAGAAFIKSWGLTTSWNGLLLNLDYLAMLALSLAGIITAWWYLYYEKTNRQSEKFKAIAFYMWGLLWWGASIFHEVDRYAVDYHYGMLIGMAGITAWVASKVYSYKAAYRKESLSITVAVLIGLGVVLNLWQADHGAHLFNLHSFSIVGWGMFAALTWLSIINIREKGGLAAKIAQIGWWSWLALSISIELGWVCIEQLKLSYSSAWYQGGVMLPWLLLMAATVWRWSWVSRPLGASLDSWRNRLLQVMLVVGGVIWSGALFLPSNTSPLPWIAILNPIDLLQLSFIAIVFYELLNSERQYDRWLTSHHKMLLLSIVGFTIMTVMTLRGVHHWGSVAWNAKLLTNNLTQTSLSILWSALGVASWIWGSRKGQRLVWWGGAVLMGVVLAKLLLIDRQELGNVLGIVSFIGYGLLCVVVGYFAPAPPKEVLNEAVDKEGI